MIFNFELNKISNKIEEELKRISIKLTVLIFLCRGVPLDIYGIKAKTI